MNREEHEFLQELSERTVSVAWSPEYRDMTKVEQHRVLDSVLSDGLCALSERRNGDTARLDQLKHMNQAEFTNQYLELHPVHK